MVREKYLFCAIPPAQPRIRTDGIEKVPVHDVWAILFDQRANSRIPRPSAVGEIRGTCYRKSFYVEKTPHDGSGFGLKRRDRIYPSFLQLHGGFTYKKLYSSNPVCSSPY